MIVVDDAHQLVSDVMRFANSKSRPRHLGLVIDVKDSGGEEYTGRVCGLSLVDEKGVNYENDDCRIRIRIDTDGYESEFKKFMASQIEWTYGLIAPSSFGFFLEEYMYNERDNF